MLKTELEIFYKNLESVDELARFDKFILDYCINQMGTLNMKLKGPPHYFNNPLWNGDNALKAIRNIRENDTLRNHYYSMYNSCIVLQSSYLASILEEIFKKIFSKVCIYHNFKEEYYEKVMLDEKVNFQNMHAVIKVYKNHLNYIIREDDKFKDLNFLQQSRHVLVHSNGYADENYMKKIANCRPRKLKKAIGLDDKLQFTYEELVLSREIMTQFVDDLVNELYSIYSFMNL